MNYAYTSGSTKAAGACKVTPTIPLNYTSTFQYNLNGNTALLKQIISNYGPVAIAIHVSSSGLFQNYKTGIFTDALCPNPTDCSKVNHGNILKYFSTILKIIFNLKPHRCSCSWLWIIIRPGIFHYS